MAGNGGRAYGGDGGAATGAYLGNPHDVAVDREGNFYVADTRYSHVRRIDKSGVIEAYVGNGFPGDQGDGGPSISACVTSPFSVAVGPDGDLYLGDSVGRIRKVERSTGIIRTVVGTGVPGYAGDGGSADQASISGPFDMDFDGDGNLYFADTGNHCVRRVTSSGQIQTVVGTGIPGRAEEGLRPDESQLDSPRGVALDSDGTLFVSDTGNDRVLALDPQGRLRVAAGTGEGGDGGDGGPANACRFNQPCNLAVMEGCLLISDHFNNRIRALKLSRQV